MSEHAEKHRKEGRAKVQRYLRKDPGGKIDASGYKPPDELMAEVKTGLRPISKRQFKKGGRVHGEDAKHHACRKTRQVGGGVNEDTKAANKHRAGEKHVGGFKKGGEARKPRDAGGPAVTGGPIANLPQVPTGGLYGSGFGATKAGALASAAGLKRGGKVRNPGNDRITGTAPTGGRLAKADGGRTKKGAVNIVIAVGGHKPEEGAGGPPGPMGPPLAHPPIPPQPVGGAAAGVAPNGGMPMPGGAPPMQMPPPNMGRKHGGSVKHAAGGGEGRLDKIRKYGKGV